MHAVYPSAIFKTDCWLSINVFLVFFWGSKSFSSLLQALLVLWSLISLTFSRPPKFVFKCQWEYRVFLVVCLCVFLLVPV